MKFQPTPLQGACVVVPDKFDDERGYLARTFCRREFEGAGLVGTLAQCNTSMNHRKGTLRGMHFQRPPHGEDKLVRCVSGALHDVIIDLRGNSPTYLQHFAVELTAENLLALFIPKGFAHGFLTLEDRTEVFYQMSTFYEPGHGDGVRFNDPAFGINWPGEVRVISDRDRNYPDYDEAKAL